MSTAPTSPSPTPFKVYPFLSAVITLVALTIVAAILNYTTNLPARATGPLRIVRSAFDYHETMQRADGSQFEFNHAAVVEALMEQGALVEVTYKGDLTSPHFDTIVVSVKVLEHSPSYIADHPELWPVRRGHWNRAQTQYILDDTQVVCATIDPPSSWMPNDSWRLVVEAPPVGRKSLYVHYTGKAPAVAEAEKQCR